MKKIVLFLTLFIPFLFVNADIKTNEFVIHNSITNNDITDNYYYSDDYFKKSSYLKNDHLRTFSLALIISTNQTSIMQDIGLSNIKTYEDDKNEINTIGTTIGYKKVDDYNLIIVSIKNGKKEEWASNFLLGISGDAKGFGETSNLAINRIKTYIKDNNLENNKILISGYSRSGSIANLVGVYINEHLDEFDTKSNNLFVYTFEAANSSSSKKVYKNIHNVINHNDLVTYVYPKKLGLNLNGVEENVTTENKKIMSKYFDQAIKDNVEVDEKEFLEQFFSVLTNNITRDDYVSIESDISNIILIYTKLNKEEQEKLKKFFTDAFNKYLYDEEGNLNILNGLNLLTLLNSKDKDTTFAALQKIKEYLNTYDENKDYLEIEDKIINICQVFQNIIYDDYNIEIKGKKYPLYYTLTFINNLQNLITEHYSDTIWKSVKEKDSYYTLGPGKENKNDLSVELFGIIGLISVAIISIAVFTKMKN